VQPHLHDCLMQRLDIRLAQAVTLVEISVRLAPGLFAVTCLRLRSSRFWNAGSLSMTCARASAGKKIKKYIAEDQRHYQIFEPSALDPIFFWGIFHSASLPKP